MKKEKSCGAVVFRLDEGGRMYLIIHMNQGHWSFPKGHVETGESEIETAIREIREETGLTVVIDPEFRMQTEYSPYPGVWKEVVFFLARTEKANLALQSAELQEARWMQYPAASARLTYPSDREILEKANCYLDRHQVSK